jgi:hypothetical protein
LANLGRVANLIPFEQALDLHLEPGELLAGLQVGSDQFAVVPGFTIGDPHRGQRVAGQHVPAEQFQDAQGVLLVVLALAVLGRAFNPRGGQHVTGEALPGELIIQPEALPRGFIGEDHLGAAGLGGPPAEFGHQGRTPLGIVVKGPLLGRFEPAGELQDQGLVMQITGRQDILWHGQSSVG